jgi:hypothetical protein
MRHVELVDAGRVMLCCVDSADAAAQHLPQFC